MEWGAPAEKVDFEGSRSGLVNLAMEWENFGEKVCDLKDGKKLNTRVICQGFCDNVGKCRTVYAM